jgi:hypothetical protein
MKKNLFIIICCIITLGSFGQSVPNGGFESWQVTSFENPAFFQTSNYKKDNNVVSPVNVVKTTDAYHGNYAIKLTTALSGTTPAFAFFADGNPGSNQGSGGIPYTQKPTGIRFRYKTNIIGTDSAMFICWFKKSGSYIGQYTYKFATSHSSYTLFDMNFATPLPQNPDTIVVAAASSNAFLQVAPSIGNMFQVDSITFKGVASQPLNFNGDFENWITESYDNLNGWPGTQNIQRVTDAYSGTYALELQTTAPGFGNNQYSSGFAGTGVPTQTTTLFGYPYSQQLDTLIFYYKYLPAHPLDSARIFANFKQNGNYFANAFKLLPIAASYTRVKIPWNLSQVPDTLMVSVESSKYPLLPIFAGSDLKIDNMYLKSQMIPISNFITPSVGCIGQPVQLQDNSFNMANAWGWIMPGGMPGSSTAQNPVVVYNSVGIKTITMISSNQFGSGATISKTISINAIPSVVSSSTVKACGATGSVVLTASGASSYSWNNGATTATILVNPNVSTSYTVTGTSSGCSNDAVGQVIVPTPPQPNICMVTVDSLNQNNEIYWDKSAYPMLDSMIIYREVITNTYKRIGAVSIDSLSYFRDTTRSVGPANGNPNISTYRYKIQVRDTCGNYGPKSLWHNTVFFTHTGSTFFWSNNYQIEGPINPIVTYSLLVCQNPTVNPAYQVVGTTTGNQNQLNDIFYSIYSATADWRVIGDFGYSCYALRPTSQGKSTPVTRSNISNNRAAPDVSLKENAILSTVKIYPNPAQNYLNVELFSGNTEVEMKLTNILGQVVYTDNASGNKTIDVSGLSKGVYMLSVRSGDTKKVFKVVLD